MSYDLNASFDMFNTVSEKPRRLSIVNRFQVRRSYFRMPFNVNLYFPRDVPVLLSPPAGFLPLWEKGAAVILFSNASLGVSSVEQALGLVAARVRFWPPGRVDPPAVHLRFLPTESQGRAPDARKPVGPRPNWGSLLFVRRKWNGTFPTWADSERAGIKICSFNETLRIS